jgi:hypothetical protein
MSTCQARFSGCDGIRRGGGGATYRNHGNGYTLTIVRSSSYPLILLSHLDLIFHPLNFTAPPQGLNVSRQLSTPSASTPQRHSQVRRPARGSDWQFLQISHPRKAFPNHSGVSQLSTQPRHRHPWTMALATATSLYSGFARPRPPSWALGPWRYDTQPGRGWREGAQEKEARSGVAAMNTTKHLWSGSISALV